MVRFFWLRIQGGCVICWGLYWVKSHFVYNNSLSLTHLVVSGSPQMFSRLQGRQSCSDPSETQGCQALHTDISVQMLTPGKATLTRCSTLRGGHPIWGLKWVRGRAEAQLGPSKPLPVKACTPASTKTLPFLKIVKKENEAACVFLIKINKWPQIKGFKLCT